MAVSTPRKGYRRRSDIPADVLYRLNTAQEETITLVEILAVDFTLLWQSALPDLPSVTIEPTLGITQRMKLAGEHWAGHATLEAIQTALTHPSDVVRGWAAYAIAHHLTPMEAGTSPDLSEVFDRLMPLADDPNPGVREWAWLACRPLIVADPHQAIRVLTPWTQSPSSNIRRFASEATRPRGVWCAHSGVLKKQPELALPILSPLKADDAKYVQDSVANWLNDASKDHPDWVVSLCQQWLEESPVKATQRIAQRAQRSIRKKPKTTP